MRTLVAIGLVAALAAPAAAEWGPVAAGVIVGEPTGATLRVQLGEANFAIQAGGGYAFFAHGIQGHLDVIYHPVHRRKTALLVSPFYLGLGARWLRRDEREMTDAYHTIGGRLLGGVVFPLDDRVPVAMFGEVAAVVEYALQGDAGWGFTANVVGGARYHF